MPDAYGVTPEDVAAELPHLFRGGFGAETAPNRGLVLAWIAAADVRARLAAMGSAAGVPSAGDAAAPVARAFIVMSVRGQALELAYTGKADPSVLAEMQRRRLEDEARMLAVLTALGEAAIGAGDEVPGPAPVVFDYSATAVTSLRGGGA